MQHCSNFLSVYNVFQIFVKTHHFAVIKCFKCDLGGKYTSNASCELLASHETTHHTSYSDIIQHNLLRGDISILLKLFVPFYCLYAFILNS